MQIIITENRDNKITVTEDLEPTYASYFIEQGKNEICLDEYQAKELINALKFVIKRKWEED